jgi:nucleotide-binding universal stress UspA family protein
MRILLAVDGSTRAEVARELVTNVSWPARSAIRVITVREPVNVFFGTPWAPTIASHMGELDAQLDEHAESIIDEAARAVARTGCTVERAALLGRPATTIIEQATDWRADVIVMGSRGHGTIATMLLGSVTAEVVDHGPCPVLVARGARLQRVIVAHDGSAFARRGEDLVAGWPIFDEAQIEVVSVAPGGPAWRAGAAPASAAHVADGERASEQVLTEHTATAADAAGRLRQAGRHATHAVVHGQPAPAIIGVAQNADADLVVVGTHGRTGLTRVMLGSVARNVMLHAPCSVLVARGATTG